MKSFEEWEDSRQKDDPFIYDAKDSYNAGITEGIAEGRRLERIRMMSFLKQHGDVECRDVISEYKEWLNDVGGKE